MNILLIVKIVLAFIITSVIPFVTAIYSGYKKAKSSKTETEKQSAINDMKDVVLGFIGDAEMLYKNIDSMLKQRGTTSGAIKKENVMTKLHAYAIEKGYEFDSEYWSNKIDEIVALTKNVNA